MSALQNCHPEKEIKEDIAAQAWKDNDGPGAFSVAFW